MTSSVLATIRKASLGLSLLATISIILLSASPAKAGITITQSTCPIVIDQPGTYFLATDVGPCAPGVDGIDISASNVTLQLAGHTITSGSRKTARRRTICGSIGSSRVYKYVHAGGQNGNTNSCLHSSMSEGSVRSRFWSWLLD
jgi:hypothetical protein